MEHTTSQCVDSEPLTPGMITGLAVSSAASFASLVSILYLGGRVVVKYRQNVRSPPDEPWRLLRTDIDAYMLGALCAEVVVSVGGLIDAQWAITGRTTCGPTCDAQGALAQVGITATSIFMIAIAVQTWLRAFMIRVKPYSRITWVSVSIATWGFVGLERFGFTLSYATLVLRDRVLDFGQISARAAVWSIPSHLDLWGREHTGRIKWAWVPQASEDEMVEEERSEAWKMLLFLVLGFSITRWMSFRNPSLSDLQQPELAGMAAASLIFRIIFRLSGVVTAGLVLLTRPNLLLHGVRGVLLPNDPRAVREYELRRLGQL
ncbi:transmembrane protein, putative [Rhizoctonia solani AG-3 Rhs1AP]|uniref:Transmembrane protein, putative n=1 Tax=Rhizoctonia solani AG-3 Rhs1AP TaxID=1086054 RepID=X8JQY7_9AGAM|nr:transmembrane protein, putative [Rhizoctonia solani AG-3 Rhs1AP]